MGAERYSVLDFSAPIFLPRTAYLPTQIREQYPEWSLRLD